MNVRTPADLPGIKAIELELERRSGEKIWTYYPDEGPLRRDLYPKHLSFFAAGLEHRERLFLAANRVGKTEGVGSYEATCHLTGQYPDWWVGRRFDRPIEAWAAGDTSKTVRDILQKKMLGPVGNFGSAMIPAGRLVHTVRKTGVADAVEIVYVRHASGGNSELLFKSYDQGRESFQGTDMDLIWLDEEPKVEIYVECVMRTMTTEGLILCTFTPLKGLTPLIDSFLKNEEVDLEAGGDE